LQPLENRGFIVRGEVACRVTPKSLPNTDVAVVRRDRWDAVDSDDFIQEAPALAIEVVSPGNRNPKLLTKVDLYSQHGAEQVWMIYPKTRTVQVLTQDGGNWEAREGESVSFHALDLQVSDLFS
jgi:Uma2 family endonuclease